MAVVPSVTSRVVVVVWSSPPHATASRQRTVTRASERTVASRLGIQCYKALGQLVCGPDPHQHSPRIIAVGSRPAGPGGGHCGAGGGAGPGAPAGGVWRGPGRGHPPGGG